MHTWVKNITYHTPSNIRIQELCDWVKCYPISSSWTNQHSIHDLNSGLRSHIPCNPLKYSTHSTGHPQAEAGVFPNSLPFEKILLVRAGDVLVRTNTALKNRYATRDKMCLEKNIGKDR